MIANKNTQNTPKDPATLPLIGNTIFMTVAGISDVPAKVDTGATGSSVWASNIKMNDQNEVEFTLFAPGSKYYTGEILKATEYSVRRVRNSTGHEQIRYRVKLPTIVKGRRIRMNFTLTDRSINQFPVLIGARSIRGKFLVNVAEREIPILPHTDEALKQSLADDPQAFHRKHME